MGSNWIYRPREVLDENCPTRLDGVSAEREEARRLAYTALLQDVGEAMKMCECSASSFAIDDQPLSNLESSCQHTEG